MPRFAIVVVASLVLFGVAGAAAAAEPITLRRTGTLSPAMAAGKENSGIVKSRTGATNPEGVEVFWTLNDSGDEPRVYPVRRNGTPFMCERYPDMPGTLIAGAIDGDWEDIAVTASGHLIIGDIGNNSNARSDLTLYIISEPEATEGRTGLARSIRFRYPDQTERPAPKADFNFDSEAIFTVGDDVYILTKHRSDTFTRLYRLDLPRGQSLLEAAEGVTHTLTYLDRFDVRGQVTAADATPDGLKLAVLTYHAVWLFERRELSQPFFAGRVLHRAYQVAPDGAAGANNLTQCEAICFIDDQTLMICDEEGGQMFELPVSELAEVRPHRPARWTAEEVASKSAADVTVMSFNIRFGTADDGPNAWPTRRELVAEIMLRADADIIATQESLDFQNQWLAERLAGYTFHGAGRADGRNTDEFSGLWYRTDRFVPLGSGHFWLSQTPDVPGSKSWDSSLPRMASWVRLFDSAANRPVLAICTHFDHRGDLARDQSVAILREHAQRIGNGDPIILCGDFNTPANHPRHAQLRTGSQAIADGLTLIDTFDAVYPDASSTADHPAATFCGFRTQLAGPRIDWVLVTPDFDVVDAEIDRLNRFGRYPSDHYPVTARVRYATRPK